MSERDVINAFVAYLRKNGHPRLRVDRWPDQENRNSPEIDAIAGPFAIEHTSIDTLPNQRRDSDRFSRVVARIGQELEGQLPFRLSVTLEYHAIRTGQNWTEIREALKEWINHDAYSLPERSSVIEDAPGIPFRLHVSKSGTGRPGLFFARRKPDDDTLPKRVRDAFTRKAEKLAKHKKLGYITILLVENDDIALMHEAKMLEAIKTAFPSEKPEGVDQVWYVDTSIEIDGEFRNFTCELVKRPCKSSLL